MRVHLYIFFIFIFIYFWEDGRGGRTGNLESKYRGLSCVLLGLDCSLLLGLVDRAVELVVHDIEVRLWNEIFHIFLPELNITAKRRFSQTVGEAGDLEGVEDPFTDQVGVLDHLGAGDLSE